MGKERIERTFQNKLLRGEKLFIPYLMAGDGGLDVLDERIQFLEKCGVSAIELGIPFSDPVADGPTIQKAGLRSLKEGTTLTGVLKHLKKCKKTRTVPIILMAYLNPIYRYGLENFAVDAKEAGVDGVIIPDVPLEEEELVTGYLHQHHIAFIRLVALTSSRDRVKEIASRSEGFLYAVSVMGTTRARKNHDSHVKDYLEMLKRYSSVPVLAGFGVSNVEQARKLSYHCDGVIVGSRIVELFHEDRTEEIKVFIRGSIHHTLEPSHKG